MAIDASKFPHMYLSPVLFGSRRMDGAPSASPGWADKHLIAPLVQEWSVGSGPGVGFLGRHVSVHEGRARSPQHPDSIAVWEDYPVHLRQGSGDWGSHESRGTVGVRVGLSVGCSSVEVLKQTFCSNVEVFLETFFSSGP